jgi:hypothetical protein
MKFGECSGMCRIELQLFCLIYCIYFGNFISSITIFQCVKYSILSELSNA